MAGGKFRDSGGVILKYADCCEVLLDHDRSVYPRNEFLSNPSLRGIPKSEIAAKEHEHESQTPPSVLSGG
jgi:hypothetical protein